MSSHGGSRNVSVVSGNGRQTTKDEYSIMDGPNSDGVSCKSFLCGTERRRYSCYCISFAAFLLLVGIITPMIMDVLIKDGIHDSAVIDSTSASSYDVWQSNFFGSGDKTQIDYDIYMFDTQNPNEVLSGAKPVVVEKGPYAFKKYFNKFDISWSDGGDTVTYNTQNFYVFNPERTAPGLSVDDEITLPYPVVLGFEYLLENLPVATEAFLDATVEAMVNDKLLAAEAEIDAQIDAVNANPDLTQEEKDAMIGELNQAKGLIEQVRLGIIDYIDNNDAGTSILKLVLCMGNPQGISPFFKTDPVSAYFGYLNDPLLLIMDQLLLKMGKPNDSWSTAVPGVAVNYTTESDTARRANPLVQKTGKDDMTQIGEIVVYDNMPKQWVCVNSADSQDPDAYVKGVEYPACELYQYDWNETTARSKGYTLAFATDYANRIEGGDANLFQAPMTDDKVQIYIPDIYRTLFLEHTGDNEDWYDVKLRRYQIQPKDLQNATENVEEGWQYFNYAPTGMENLTLAGGLPLFASKPHFLDAASSLQTAVSGTNARREIHDTFLDIEPNTGMLARVHKRLQVNYQMNNYDLPEVTEDAVAAANALCEMKNMTCDGLNMAMQCLAIPSNWQYLNNRVYMPYAWADEHMVGTEDDADSVKDGVYWAQDFGTAVRFWCFVSVGLIAAIVAGFYWGESRTMIKYGLHGDDENAAQYQSLLG
mmetsp:Transcript_9558/g.17942  ORF Transcript_9558/g.17942 Transcript_9558/m.17942 type:complete len:704 (-) Transcript_9558:163-2274(-)